MPCKTKQAPLVPMPAPSEQSDDLQQPLLHDHQSTADPYNNVNWFTFAFFGYATTLLKLANSRVITLHDIPPIPAQCQSEVLVSQFLSIWEAQKKIHGKHSLVLALLKCFWVDILKTGILALLKGVGVLCGPIFLYFSINYVSGQRYFKHDGIVLVVSLGIVKIVENFATRHWYNGVRVLGTKVQSCIIAAIYQKELCRSSTSRQHHTTGEVINYIAIDAFRLCEFGWRMHWCWLSPVILIGAICISYFIVGNAILPALIVIVAVLVPMSPFINSMQSAQRQFMETQDGRLRMTSEILQSMKVVKLQAWEEKFDMLIQDKREEEFKWLQNTQKKKEYITDVYWLLPPFLSCVVFITCILVGSTLTPTILFTILATFRITQDPIRNTPDILSYLVQAQIALIRLNTYLQEEELNTEDKTNTHEAPGKIVDYVVQVDNASMAWNLEEREPTLHNINMVVRHGEKVAVCGSVGAGKSSLLLALLGEMPKLSGTVHLCGRVAYVPQLAWIQSLTVRENILFGKPFDKEHYESAIRVCALEEDMKSLSHGDLTEIGEKGTNLSGGQKQRIQLARAVYNDADIYLLDDPFSAVDAQTAATLFHECVMGTLKNKTVILVTHQVEFLPHVDTILVMQNGGIKQAGKYTDLLRTPDVFQNLVDAHKEALHSVVENGEGDNEDDVSDTNLKKKPRKEELPPPKEQQDAGALTQLVQEEEVLVGTVGFKPYIEYIQVPKAELLAVIIILCQIIFSATQLYGNIWLTEGISNSNKSSKLLIGVYCGISFISVVMFIARGQMILALGLKASRSFFSKLMSVIMKAPMSFFDSTPSGRILNRVSIDINVLDLDITYFLSMVLGNTLDVLCIVLVMCIVTWQVIVVVIPLLLLANYLQNYYAAAMQQMNRINSTTKAPIVNNATETITGHAVIRAFNQVERFRKHNYELIDRAGSVYLYKFASLEWMLIRVELSCTAVLILAASLIVFQGTVSGGYAGLAITYALSLNSGLVVLCIYRAFLATYMLSVERIKQYLHLPQEAPAVIESNRPPADWPNNGEVCIENLQVRYRENSPMVLKGVTCRILGGQKIGVVGRTGSGKTTLISALFRIVEPVGGKICIDNVDIASIGLQDLRFRLGIIPQEPVLFQGTVRTNLDPLNQYNDAELWEALQKCQLLEKVQKLKLNLSSPVSDQGENWSVGQRQLFCLGRVLLKRCQVLVLDEATSSIDATTDVVIQKVIQKEFSTCTIITIAHRIPTIIDSDMVLALRNGTVAEFDTPLKLIENKTSLFSQLVAEYWAQSRWNKSISEQFE